MQKVNNAAIAALSNERRKSQRACIGSCWRRKERKKLQLKQQIQTLITVPLTGEHKSVSTPASKTKVPAKTWKLNEGNAALNASFEKTAGLPWPVDRCCDHALWFQYAAQRNDHQCYFNYHFCRYRITCKKQYLTVPLPLYNLLKTWWLSFSMEDNLPLTAISPVFLYSVAGNNHRAGDRKSGSQLWWRWSDRFLYE